MPILVQVAAERVIGKPAFPIVAPPLHDMKGPVRVMLSDTYQQYDEAGLSPLALQRDELLDDFFGVRGDGPGFSEDFTDEQQGISQWGFRGLGRSPGQNAPPGLSKKDLMAWRFQHGMKGLGALPKKGPRKLRPARPVPMATASAPPQVENSTRYVVAGGAVLAIAASVALWAYFKHGKGNAKA